MHSNSYCPYKWHVQWNNHCIIWNVLLAKVSESCHRGETEIQDTKLDIEVTEIISE